LKYSLIVILVLLMTTSSAMAQHVEQGDREIQVNAFFFAVSGVSMLNLSGSYGYYKTDKLELGGGPSISRLDYGFGSSTTIGLTLFGRYNLTARDQIVPYLSAQFYQYDIAPDDPMGFADFAFLQCGGGFKYFINEYIAYDVSGNLGFSLGGGDVSFIAVGGLSAFF
jgi:hypothetical protein